MEIEYICAPGSRPLSYAARFVHILLLTYATLKGFPHKGARRRKGGDSTSSTAFDFWWKADVCLTGSSPSAIHPSTASSIVASSPQIETGSFPTAILHLE
jgi:hypothetical protein